ncbi:uncharacterized protein LOC110694449 isoform X2 [Chenopodium quinoa]|nr:uncharacterized protein LOC110694449 isoform X2 [Chenopodium quinoa]
MALIFCSSSIAPITPTHISGLKPSDYELKPRNVRPLQKCVATDDDDDSMRSLTVDLDAYLVLLQTKVATGENIDNSPVLER